MTPQQHLDLAEQLLATPPSPEAVWLDYAYAAKLLAAIGHSLVALAVETGVPHPPAAAGGETSA